ETARAKEGRRFGRNRSAAVEEWRAGDALAVLPAPVSDVHSAHPSPARNGGASQRSQALGRDPTGFVGISAVPPAPPPPVGRAAPLWATKGPAGWWWLRVAGGALGCVCVGSRLPRLLSVRAPSACVAPYILCARPPGFLARRRTSLPAGRAQMYGPSALLGRVPSRRASAVGGSSHLHGTAGAPGTGV
ncbi:unnamed protein product, partial [Amoebophrya sp. A120]